MIGRQVSHYRIVSALGSGGMGSVYRAEDTRLGRPVALKFPRPEPMREAAVRERFLREARIASALDHPNIVVLYDVGEVDGEVFLAMQCVEGSSLRERLAAGAVSTEEALSIGRGVADALAHAHARGVVHRDIKPENILLTGDGRVKVADFGIAVETLGGSLMSTEMIAGTPAYMAPEILRGEPASPHSDVYALGAVLHEMLSGAPAFTGTTVAEVLYRVAHEAPAELTQRLAEPVRRLVRQLLAKRPADRPSGAVAVADALASILSGAPAKTTEIEAPAGRSIAVLPFENLTGKPEDEYLCAGITEDLLTDVLKIPDLQTASRGMVGARRSGTTDVREVGRDLGVAMVLEGGVQRAGERVRVTARLVRTDTGYPLWAERYDRRMEDVFEMQEDISRRIAEALRVVFEPETDDSRFGRRTSSSKAYDLRLRAMALSRQYEDGEMRKAIDLLEEALREDPDYALARADLAESITQLICKSWESDRTVLIRAKEEADRALEIAPRLPEAFRARGHIWMHRRRPDLAIADYQRASELDPRLLAPLNSLAVAYILTGDMGRAEVYARRAHQADPFHFAPFSNLAVVTRLLRRFDESREWSRLALAMPLGRYGHLTMLGELMRCDLAERNDAGIAHTLEELDSYGSNPYALSLIALASAALGRPDEARRRLVDPVVAESVNTSVHIAAARAWVLLGERARAVESLNRSFQIDIVDLGTEWRDPLLADLVADSRFDELRAFEAAAPR